VRHTSTITQINPLLALTDVTIETSKPGLPEQLLSSAPQLLFVTGWAIKKFGVEFVLLISVF
jgi:hypothetical protein